MKIPPAIDSAMWEVVESDDQALMDEFAERYPQFKGELAKRLSMVRDLKGSRPIKTSVKPAFKPRNDVVITEPGLTWNTSTVMIAVVGAALLTFGSVRLYDQLRPQPPAAPIVQHQPKNPDIQMYVPEQKAPGATTGSQPQTDPGPGITQPEIDPAQLDPFQRRVTVATQDAMLSAVLQDIATQANLVLEAAPGMPDERIQAQYVNVPAMKILEDLGRTFGFTPLKQSRRSALLIPARDRGRTTGGLPPTGSQDPTETTGSTPLTGPVNPKEGTDGVLPPVGN